MADSSQPNLDLQKFEDSNLWKRLQSFNEVDLQANVQSVAKGAASLLSDIARHMPLYTLHNEQHVLNIIGWMDWLLADSLNRLSAIDCTLLLMSSYTHDLGMALSASQFTELVEETDQPTGERLEFQTFLDGYSDELHQIERLHTEGKHYLAEMIRNHLLTEFLRSTHADKRGARMDSHLRSIEKDSGKRDLFRYRGAWFLQHLEKLNISHNQDPGWIRCEMQSLHHIFGQETLQLSLLGSVLRLADILDFDASRTPTILFRHLGVDSSTSIPPNQMAASQQAWRNHLSVNGIRYESETNTLKFSAADCPDPVTEKTIRTFIDWIKEEIASAQGQPLRLPIVKLDIKPCKDEAGKDRYEYHDWQFHLSHAEIVDLLMGESLYGDPGLAIRELAQNALDALELRDLRLQYLKKTARNSSSSKPDGVPAEKGYFYCATGEKQPLEAELSWGFDEGQKQSWLQVSDNGVGMTRETIDRFFTNLGKSYYRSEKYKSEEAALRRAGLISTPISQFGIGILSCFMLATRIEVKTNAGGGEATDLVVSGPGSIFWTMAGTRPVQGTDVKLWLKREWEFKKFEPSHYLQPSVTALRTFFGYDEVRFRTLGNKNELDPFFQLASAIIWPKYPCIVKPPDAATATPIDELFHARILAPIDVAAFRAKAAEWDLPLPEKLALQWERFDWVDEDGPDATGSRIRVWFPADKPTGQPEAYVAGMPGWKARGVVHSTNRWGTRFIFRSMSVEASELVPQNICLSHGVGLPVWVDFRGPAVSPRLTPDRRSALEPSNPDLWKRALKDLFGRFFAYLKGKPCAEWLSLPVPANERIDLAIGARNSPVQESTSLAFESAFLEASNAFFLQALDLDRTRDLARTFDRNLARDLALTRALDRALGRAIALAIDLDRDLDRARDRDLSRALSLDLALDLDLALELDLRGEFREETLLLASHVLQEACYTNLRESWPPLGLFRYDGQIADARLTSPAVFRFSHDPSGKVHPPTAANVEVLKLEQNQFDLCFPMTSVPLWPLRERTPDWGRDRSLRRVGALPFLDLKILKLFAGQPDRIAQLLPLGHLYAFVPTKELWEKPFLEWTEADWQNSANRSMLWLIEQGRILQRPGLVSLNELRAENNEAASS